MNDETEPLIRLIGVRKVFYTDELETHALSDVHLEVHSGQFVEVMGPSGCGKSTLLAIVGLLDTPTDGEYWLEGRPMFRLSGTERAKVRNDSTPSNGWVCRTGQTTTRASCRAASSNESRRPGPSSDVRRFSWPTSRPVTWIRPTASP